MTSSHEGVWEILKFVTRHVTHLVLYASNRSYLKSSYDVLITPKASAQQLIKKNGCPDGTELGGETVTVFATNQ